MPSPPDNERINIMPYQFKTEYGNQFKTEYGNQFITEYGNQLAIADERQESLSDFLVLCLIINILKS